MKHTPNAALAAALLFMAGCTADRPLPTVVEVSNVHFSPADISVQVGDTVEWRFLDGGILHQVWSESDQFDSGVIGDGTFSHTFDVPGTYTYFCSVHRYMTGSVTVTDSL